MKIAPFFSHSLSSNSSIVGGEGWGEGALLIFGKRAKPPPHTTLSPGKRPEERVKASLRIMKFAPILR